MGRKFWIFTLLLGASLLQGLAANLQPQMEMTATAQGTKLILDLSQIEDTDWQTLLSDPYAFDRSGFGVAGAPGQPALPMFTRLIPVLSSTAVDPVILDMSTHALQDISLKAVPEPVYDGEVLSNVFEYDIDRNGLPALEQIQVGEEIGMLGHRFLPVTFRPVIPSADGRELLVATRIEFLLPGIPLDENLMEGGGDPVRRILTPSDVFPDLGHYLIITPPVFQSALAGYVDWKQRKGFKVTVVSTTETGSNAAMIKSYIQTAWETWDDPPDFVVLVGDEDQGIPGHYIMSPEQQIPLVTDHPYACLEGDDSFPEVWVGRFSVDTASQLVTLINKIMTYERNPYMTDDTWFTRALMICNADYAISTRYTKNWIRRKMLENGYSQVDTSYYPDQWGTSEITTAINDGVTFVNYRGFGDYTGWWGPNFTLSNLGGIQNGPKLPVITSVVCGGGNFAAGVDPCFGEQWIRMGSSAIPRGAVAFYGPSELYTHTQFNNVMDIGIYSGIFDKGIHTLGPALWNGKLELWENYYQNTYFPHGQDAVFYHHIYNLLGDPGLSLWTATPQGLAVGHPQILHPGDDFMDVTVLDSTGAPVVDAFVNLFNAENATGAWSDTNGFVSLPVIMGEASELYLTVTGDNLRPYEATIPLDGEPYPLNLESWTVGDSDLLDAGAVLPMLMDLRVGSNPISQLEVHCTVIGTGVNVNDTTIIRSDLSPDSNLDLSGLFQLQVDAEAEHGVVVRLRLDVVADTVAWTWQRTLPIQAPHVVLTGAEILSGNAQPGDSAVVRLQLSNTGGMVAADLRLILQEHPLLHTDGDTLHCALIDPDSTVWTTDSLLVRFDHQIYPGEILDFEMECLMAGRVDTLAGQADVGELNPYAPGLADAYGYYLFDENDVSYSKLPSYTWYEVDPDLGAHGDVLPLTDQFENMDDQTLVELPWPVQFYGQTHAHITVGSNGWAAFGASPEISFHNRRIPSPIGPNAMIAAFWDDLITQPGHVVTYTTPDNALFIIEWSRMRHRINGSTETFEIIIRNTDQYPTPTGDNEIVVQLKQIANVDLDENFATIGIESPDYSTGIEVTYNNVEDPSVDGITSHKVFLFTTDRGEKLQPTVMDLSATTLDFQQTPWVTSRDTLVILNQGPSLLLYNIEFAGEEALLSEDGESVRVDVSPTRDAAGYGWVDNTEPDGPSYDWVDIIHTDNFVEWCDDPNDCIRGPFSLGFSFPFYDQIYDEIWISSNGTISFESDDPSPDNVRLPSIEAPPALIAAFWDDINRGNVELGELYYYTDEEDMAVITWYNIPKIANYYRYTFQAILTRDGDIRLQYQYISGPTTSATVGIQNSAGDTGELVFFNQANNLESGRVILISRPYYWFQGTGWNGLVDAGESVDFIATVTTNGVPLGHYEIPLVLYSNAAGNPIQDLLVNLDVVAGVLPAGDINGDYHPDVQDLMLLLDFILLIETPEGDQFGRADLVSDGVLNISDAIAEIELILAYP